MRATSNHRAQRLSREAAGFTVIELLIAAIVGFVVVGALLQLMVNQNRLYGVHQAEREVQQTLYASMATLGWQLREARPAEGDLYAIGMNSIRLRSTQGSGIVCASAPNNSHLRVALQGSSGFYQASSIDSALVWGVEDQQWHSVRINRAWNNANQAYNRVSPTCFWGDSSTNYPRPEAAIQLRGTAASAAALAAVGIGSWVNAFRPIEYGMYQDNGRWWLGRRVGNASAWERLTGPLRSPADSGLVFTYRDGSGNVTNNRSQVASIEILMRAESETTPGRPGVAASGSGPRAVQDSLRTIIHLRNS